MHTDQRKRKNGLVGRRVNTSGMIGKETPMALSCGITKAGPNDPIYKNGWTVGGTSSAASSKDGQTKDQSHLVPDTPSGMAQEVAMIFGEAREQWSGFDMECVESFKRGDRIGLPFEGGTMFQPVNEQRLELALHSNQGSDESSIVDNFLKFVGNYDYTTREQFVWDWLSYHQLHHGTGYGRTYKDHFNLMSYIRKHKEKYPDLDSRISKLQEIAADTDSFGNGSLALVYPAYYYSAVVGEEPRQFVEYVTSFTHANCDATKAVNLLMDIIEGKHVEPPTEEYIRAHCTAEHATAYNTLLTAMFIADAETENEVIRRGVWVSGDTDSTLATAMLLWSLKNG